MDEHVQTATPLKGGNAAVLELGEVSCALPAPPPSYAPNSATEDAPHLVIYRVLPKVFAFILFMMLHDYLQEQLQFQFESKSLRLPSIFTLLDMAGCFVGPFLSLRAGGSVLWPENLSREDFQQTFFPLALITVASVALANAATTSSLLPSKSHCQEFQARANNDFRLACVAQQKIQLRKLRGGSASVPRLGAFLAGRPYHSLETIDSEGVIYIMLSQLCGRCCSCIARQGHDSAQD